MNNLYYLTQSGQNYVFDIHVFALEKDERSARELVKNTWTGDDLDESEELIEELCDNWVDSQKSSCVKIATSARIVGSFTTY
jgi:hypothetical protein